MVGPGRRWGADDIVDLTGRTALVTGANSGIGAEVAMQLAVHGARVLLAARNVPHAGRTAELIEGRAPTAVVEVIELDLTRRASVAGAVAAVERRTDRLDLLVNNAGVMAVPFGLTAEGTEEQFATNVLGPFALSAGLAGLLVTTGGSRVVTVCSNLHRLGMLDLSGPDALQGLPGGINPWLAYANTKLADLVLAFELDRRLKAAGAPSISVAAHPGYARTALVANGPASVGSPLRRRATRLFGRLGQSPAAGALPVLYAATAPGLHGGEYAGPSGPGHWWGPPILVGCARRARDPETGARLWSRCEELSGVTFDIATPSPAGTPAGRGFTQEVS